MPRGVPSWHKAGHPKGEGKQTTNSAQGFGRGEIGPRVSQPFLVADCCLKSSTWKSGLRYYDSSHTKIFFSHKKVQSGKPFPSKKTCVFPESGTATGLIFDSNPPYVNHPWKPPMKIKKTISSFQLSLQKPEINGTFQRKNIWIKNSAPIFMIHWLMIIKKCHIQKKNNPPKLWFQKKTDTQITKGILHPSIHPSDPSIHRSLTTARLQSKELDRSHLSAGFWLFHRRLLGWLVGWAVFFWGKWKWWKSYPRSFWGGRNCFFL